MKVPASTYRVQFRNGMTFDRAAGLIPWLQRLGISHFYASPIFTALSGSTHGYDVTDANAIDPAIGGREGFDRLAKALKDAGIGLILDIVPNHMASSLENAWWYDVIEQGENSRYAQHFDIDWSRRLTLPFLGDTFEHELENGEIAIKPDPKTGKPALACYDIFYPLAPETWQDNPTGVLEMTAKAKIAALHDSQPWRLISWRDAQHDLSFRRFFEITGLVGVRVEDPAVFDETHRLILELVHSGAVNGLRIDHVDGLADPKAYLDRLREQTGEACYITVEKILGEGEQLPADWPVSGTTGYEFIASLSNALVDGQKLAALRDAYSHELDRPVNITAELRAAKLLMVGKNFEGEFTTLLRIAAAIAETENVTSDEAILSTALRELLVAFPVYRTYGTAAGLPPADSALLQKVADRVKASASAPDTGALHFLLRLLAGEISDAVSHKATTFRTKFQQLTGPLMAKSVEDTLFFRQNMALALNEVGAEPVPRTFSTALFHAEMKTRLEHYPDALSATSTHDTKRGEDARARLYTLTEAPDLWAECVTRWRAINQSKVKRLDDGPAPKPGVEWMLYQALAGVWPPQLQPQDKAALHALEERFLPFVEKALREAKSRTNWGDSNDPYEEAVLGYASHLLSPDNQTFLQDFHRSLQPFIRAGLVNSLTQTIVKLTAPGIPDIYQGSEGLNYSLVDPDNRREPDFAMLEQQLTAELKPDFSNEKAWFSGQLKLQVIAQILPVRQQQADLFRQGSYLPLDAAGKQARHVLAFARTLNDTALIVIAPRVVFSTEEKTLALSNSQRRAETNIALSGVLANREYRDLLSGEKRVVGDTLDLASVAGCALVLLSE